MHGIKHGISRGGMAGVTKDATSGIFVPASSVEWTTTMAAAGIGSGGPSALWLLQEASGNVADSIGSFTGTASGTGLSYQQSVAGWSRKGVGLTDAGSGKFTNTAAGLPSLATQSQLIIAYGIMTAASGQRNVVSAGGATQGHADIGATATFHPVAHVASASAGGSTDAHNRVLPWVFKHNVTGSAQAVYTDTEKVVPAFNALAGQGLTIGAAGNAAPTGTLLYLVSFFLGAAELTDAQVKTLLTTLGWTISWT